LQKSIVKDCYQSHIPFNAGSFVLLWILEETQSLVSKRLDRIEFMVLSALNEVPPQHRIHYEDASAVTFDPPGHSPLANDDNSRSVGFVDYS